MHSQAENELLNQEVLAAVLDAAWYGRNQRG